MGEEIGWVRRSRGEDGGLTFFFFFFRVDALGATLVSSLALVSKKQGHGERGRRPGLMQISTSTLASRLKSDIGAKKRSKPLVIEGR